MLADLQTERFAPDLIESEPHVTVGHAFIRQCFLPGFISRHKVFTWSSFIFSFLSVEKLCANCGFVWRVRRAAPQRISGGPLPEYALQEKICLL